MALCSYSNPRSPCGPVVLALALHPQYPSCCAPYQPGQATANTLEGIGELLEPHIRLEEREVFPMIEEILPEEGLKEVASWLKVKEARPQTEPWVPKEGLSYEPWPGPGDSEGGGYDWPPTPR